MAGMVGAVATLLNTLASWALDPDGFARLTREQKLERLKDAYTVALAAGAYDAVDLIHAQLKRLREAGSP